MRSRVVGEIGAVALGRDQHPAATTGLLVVVTEFAIHKVMQVRGQRANTPAASVYVSVALLRAATERGMHLTADANTDLVLMP